MAGLSNMETREDPIYQEAAALWLALFREPPPAEASGSTLLDIIARRAPIATYERLTSPHLRPATITGPKKRENYG
jgi:hypothetical protein